MVSRYRYVPLGLLGWFRGQSVHSVTELDWWQTHNHPGSDLQVTFVPAQVLNNASEQL